MPAKTLRAKHLDPAMWGLSERAIQALNNEPTILQSLAADRLLPPLPPGYVPKVIEVLFDDVPYIRTEDGVVTRLRECLEDYQPSFIDNTPDTIRRLGGRNHKGSDSWDAF
jgi:hypothetical protein